MNIVARMNSFNDGDMGRLETLINKYNRNGLCEFMFGDLKMMCGVYSFTDEMLKYLSDNKWRIDKDIRGFNGYYILTKSE